MPKRNKNIAFLQDGYLFPEIAKRKRGFMLTHKDAKLISLGVGNTTEPVMPHICAALVEGAARLGNIETYSGYMDEGLSELREKINNVYYKGKFKLNEIFISDGAKCDIGRIQILFGPEAAPFVQDPSYPVYVDGSVMAGAASSGREWGYEGISYLPCTPENSYFPDLSVIKQDSLIYFCSPNNPTGAVATYDELHVLVKRAIETNSIIIFDASYCEYIHDKGLPRSIYDIHGAERCAIEINSFSKSAGFTGVRLGWSVVPHALKFSGGESVNSDWARVQSTIFNGASNIAQFGALAALDPRGLAEINTLTSYYLRNAEIIRCALEGRGINCTGGKNAPYIWARFPEQNSWAVFERILEKCHVVTTPGSGFGPAGENFIRFSAFGHRADIEEAAKRLIRM
ncbi:MAG: LL-diaminopimelate aminotransferase [Spirochaetaceae bacterium]|jgi:LL-diaminopimelate aminotransferase|nr:LL-diaminopimelate aminotransferase [Spirochaetaceae bacterium]